MVVRRSSLQRQVSINTKLSDAQTMTFDNSQRMRTQEDVIGSLLRGEYALALYDRGVPAWQCLCGVLFVACTSELALLLERRGTRRIRAKNKSDL
jgi:hypothetical protein